MAKDLRFRSKIRHADGSMLDRARRKYRIDFREAAEEIARIVQVEGSCVTEADVHRWTLHPAELVPLTFMRSFENLARLEPFCRRAIRGAEAEGPPGRRSWTP